MTSLTSQTDFRIVALVPMRHHSERVPAKNYRPFADRPLYHYIIRSLLACSYISEIVINTDSEMISKDVSRHFPQVTLIERPEHLRADTVPMNHILIHDVRFVEADYYLQTHSTNPLLQTDTISKGVRFFLDNCSIFDSLFSVTKVQARLWDNNQNAINHDPNILLRTQDLPPVYEENSCLYIFSRKGLETNQNRIGKRPLMFEIDRMEAWDIDEELDFTIAEFLYSNYFLKKD